MKVATGSQASFEASFLVEGGSPTVLDAPPMVSFSNQSGAVFADEEVTIVNLSNGRWRASVGIPEDAEFGWYKIVWSAESEGTPISGEQFFEVVATVSEFVTEEHSLRKRLNDTLVDPYDDSNAFFTNDEIHSLLALNGGSVIGAAFDGWTMRAAEYQGKVDISESGSDRHLSQLFKNAMAMADFYKKQLGDEGDRRSQALSGRVVGVVASLRGEYVDSFGYIASHAYRGGGILSSGAYVRTWPIHRSETIPARLGSF